MINETQLFRTETDLIKAEARRKKAERTKHLGEPIELPAKPLDVVVRGKDIWIAQSDAIVHRVDLETGSTLQVYKGHTAPVTSIAFIEQASEAPLLVSGSWDKTVKVWDTKNKSIVSSTEAHSDFVKCVFVLPELKILATSGSDKVVRLWDIENPRSSPKLKTIGIISAHTRPVQCMVAEAHSPTTATLFTADTMGVIKLWSLERTHGDSANCRAIEKLDLSIHRTGVYDMWLGADQLWTASADDNVQITSVLSLQSDSGTEKSRPIPPLTHSSAVKAIFPLQLSPIGEPLLLTTHDDVICLYDISDPYSPELLSTTDAHWFDVTALRFWARKVEMKGKDGKSTMGIEPWIVSVSLDQTIRKWKLADLISPPKEVSKPKEEVKKESTLTEEEEAELAELMEDD